MVFKMFLWVLNGSKFVSHFLDCNFKTLNFSQKLGFSAVLKSG